MTDIIKASDLLAYLRGMISSEEISSLKKGEGLAISDFNRSNVLEMLEYAPCGGEDVDMEKVSRLKETLDGYLSKYLADKPEAWKWIFISCAFLSFVKRVPMHPVEKAGISVADIGGRTVYECPMREEGEDSTCRFCVCVKKEDR